MVSAKHASELFEPVTEDEVGTSLFCAVVPVDVVAVAAVTEVTAVVEVFGAVAVLEVVDVFAGDVAAAVVEADDTVVLGLEEAVLAVAAVVAALLGVVGVAEALDVTAAADEVDALSSATEEEPQPLSAEQHATRPICTTKMTVPTLITIVTHFRYCQIYGRNVALWVQRKSR